MKEIRGRLTYANVMSTIAVFLALAGSVAVAATQLPKNSVGTKQLKKNAVGTAKIKEKAVATSKIADQAVSEDKVKDGAIGTGKLGDDAVTGAKVNESTLGEVPSAANSRTVGGVPASALTVGRSGYQPSCFGTTNYECATVTLDLPRKGRVLLVSQLPMHPDAEGSSASCHLTNNGVEIPDTATDPGALKDEVSNEGSEIANGGVTVVTAVIAAGPAIFTQVCSDTGGNPHFRRTSLSAVLLGTD